jgi:hypothetical protein
MLPREGRAPVMEQTFDIPEKGAKRGAHLAAGQANLEQPNRAAVKTFLAQPQSRVQDRHLQLKHDAKK